MAVHAGDAHERLHGRRAECSALDDLLAEAHRGRSRVIVLRGEAGIGKSALLDYAEEQGSSFRVARAAGIESEMELAYAGLHQLCAPFLDRLERLPDPQRKALGSAFGLSAGESPDRFLVGLAALNLLADAAEAQPLLCIVDDAQWLDRVSAQTIAFVARRLLAERIAMVIGVREPSDDRDFAGLPDLAVRGLAGNHAAALLDSVVKGPLDARVRERILAETRGNPLALLELPQAWTTAELADGFEELDMLSLTGRIEDGFRRRLAALPDDTRRLLLTAAAEPLGDPTLLWRAAGVLKLGAEPARAAESAGLIEFGARIRFRHPLVRAAAYRSASIAERQEIHRALAEVADPRTDPDRRAWHRAQATAVPDEEIAAELERCAEQAQSRGGLVAAAALLERAAQLTPEPVRRAQRQLAAAWVKREAGALDAALTLLAAVEAGPADPLRAAEVEHLRGQIAFDQRRGTDAARLLLNAAHRLEAIDAVLDALATRAAEGYAAAAPALAAAASRAAA